MLSLVEVRVAGLGVAFAPRKGAAIITTRGAHPLTRRWQTLTRPAGEGGRVCVLDAHHGLLGIIKTVAEHPMGRLASRFLGEGEVLAIGHGSNVEAKRPDASAAAKGISYSTSRDLDEVSAEVWASAG